VLFRGPRTLSEKEFEQVLWQRMQSLTDKDVWHGQRHDRSVSPDPTNPHFSLSFAGEAFFAIGLHPKASRPARRFTVPAIVFNLHDQFEEMRKTDKYTKLHNTIMERDLRFAGSYNPMIQAFGHGSEARQYSGRVVDEAWQCPFHRVEKAKNVV
jgi:FPC/CPF motif-containing protein YcgG